MKATFKVVLAIGVLVALIGSSSSAFAKEKKLTVKDLPVAVNSAFKAAYPNAQIKEVGTETEGGVEYYEVESVDGKTKRDLLYTKDGKVYEIEEVIAAEALPEAVKQAVTKVYPQGTIEKAEKTTHEAKVEYELKIKNDAKMYQVTMDAQGKVLETIEMKLQKKEHKEKKEEREEKEEKEGKDKH